MPGKPADCVYVAASASDARFTRTCIASIRRFHPDVPIRLLCGGPIKRGLIAELQHYWGVEVARFPAGDYGWGFVKLEPLFGPEGERYLVLDSDTVLTGPVLDIAANCDAPFILDDEKQSETDTHRLYFDWRQVHAIDPQAKPPSFVSNTGQWFGTAGVIARSDFEPWLDWTMPRRLRHPGIFMCGEQGLLNYVLNQKAILSGLAVARRPIMRWPGHSMAGLDQAAVAQGIAQPLIVHWAGMKRHRQRDMVGGDLLAFFERRYYQRLPLGSIRRAVTGWRHEMRQLRSSLSAVLRRLR